MSASPQRSGARTLSFDPFSVVVTALNEPTAAAVVFGWESEQLRHTCWEWSLIAPACIGTFAWEFAPAFPRLQPSWCGQSTSDKLQTFLPVQGGLQRPVTLTTSVPAGHLCTHSATACTAARDSDAAASRRRPLSSNLLTNAGYESESKCIS